MTDITTKLHDLARWLRRLANHEPEPECKASHIECADDCTRAANEIDRLRAEVARLREAVTLAIDEIRECDDSEGVRAKLRAVLAPVAGGGVVSNWQPIESAPRGGFYFLAWSEAHGFVACNWPKNCQAGDWHFRPNAWFGNALTAAMFATHWTKLPEPPK